MLGERSQGTGGEVEIDTPDVDRDKDYVVVSKPAVPVQTLVEPPPVESQITYTAAMCNACRFSRHCLSRPNGTGLMVTVRAIYARLVCGIDGTGVQDTNLHGERFQEIMHTLVQDRIMEVHIVSQNPVAFEK